MDTNKDTAMVRTVEDYLFGCVNFEIPDDIVSNISMERNFPLSANAAEVGRDNLRLMKADLYKWIVLSPSRVNDIKEQDNNWSHAGGGYAFTDADKKLLKKVANEIYEELEPESVFGKTKIRMRSAGIMPAYRDVDGKPLPRKPL